MTHDEKTQNVIEGFAELQHRIFANAVRHGWWEGELHNGGEKIALMHSELSEALEAMRKDPNKKSEKIPAFTCVEEELADVVIRIMDYCEYMGLNLIEAIFAKHEYNITRPHRHGGKLF